MNFPSRFMNSRLRSSPLKEKALISSLSGSNWKTESVSSILLHCEWLRNASVRPGSNRATARQLQDHKSTSARHSDGAE